MGEGNQSYALAAASTPFITVPTLRKAQILSDAVAAFSCSLRVSLE